MTRRWVPHGVNQERLKPTPALSFAVVTREGPRRWSADVYASRPPLVVNLRSAGWRTRRSARAWAEDQLDRHQA